jgi:hypothetical protein
MEKVLKTPCVLGQTLYCIINNEVLELEVSEITFSNPDNYNRLQMIGYDDDSNIFWYDIYFDDISEKAFTTKEEAEYKLYLINHSPNK